MAINCDPQSLASAATCFECIPDKQAAKTYLMAVAAGGSLDPQTLANQAGCFVCLTYLYPWAEASLLCQKVGSVSCDPNSLSAAATGFENMPNPIAVELYLWGQIAGITDPQTIANNSKCFSCLAGIMLDVQIMLLATIAGASSDPNVIADGAKCFTCLGGQVETVKLYLLCQLVNAGPTPPITELGYVLTTSAGWENGAWASSSTLYFGADLFNSTLTGNGTYANQRIAVPGAGTITGWSVKARVTSPGTPEAVAFSIRINDTTDIGQFSLSYNVGVTSGSATGMSQAVTTSDFLAVKVVTPGWIGVPQGIRINAVIYVA